MNKQNQAFYKTGSNYAYQPPYDNYSEIKGYPLESNTRQHMMQMHTGQPMVQPQMLMLVDPYVFQSLQTLISRMVVIETERGTVRGRLAQVLPDHVVLQTNGSSFLIRIQQIIWVMPDESRDEQRGSNTEER